MRISILLLAIVVFCLTSVDPALAQQRTLVRVAGEPVVGSLVSMDSDSLTLAGEQGERTFSLSEIIRWGIRGDMRSGPVTILSDGSVLRADIVDLGRTALTIGLDLEKYGNPPIWENATIPLKYVVAIIYHPPADPLVRDKLIQSAIEGEGRADRLLLENGDSLEGRLLIPDAEQLSSHPDSTWLSMGGREVPVPLSRTTALFFNPSLVERLRGDEAARQNELSLGFSDGSFVRVSELVNAPQRMELRHGSGVKFSIATETFYSSVCFARPAQPDVRYLSDERPVDYHHIPFLDIQLPYRNDRNVLGGWLRAKGGIYPKGLGMHSASRLVYPIKSGDSRFEAELALDDSAGSGGSVVFEVLVLNEQWTRTHQSEIVRGSDPDIRRLRVDVSGSRAIALAVRYADYADQQDYANWLEARIVRQPD